MRKRVITAAAGVVGLVVIGLGVASATVWRADDVMVATTTASSHVVVTDPGVLELGGDPATVRVTASDGAEVVVVVGRDTDVDGWVGSDAYTRVTGLSAWDRLATTTGEPDPAAVPTDAPTPASTPAATGSPKAAATAAATSAASSAASAAPTGKATADAKAPATPTQASPAGNDNWVAQATGDGSAELVWPAQPGRWSLLAVSRGEVEPTLEISWPRVVTTPWLWPCVVVGALLVAAAGVVLLRDWSSRRTGSWEPVHTGSVPVAAAEGQPLTRRQIREAQEAARSGRPPTGGVPRVTGPQQTVHPPHEEGRHSATPALTPIPPLTPGPATAGSAAPGAATVTRPDDARTASSAPVSSSAAASAPEATTTGGPEGRAAATMAIGPAAPSGDQRPPSRRALRGSSTPTSAIPVVHDTAGAAPSAAPTSRPAGPGPSAPQPPRPGANPAPSTPGARPGRPAPVAATGYPVGALPSSSATSPTGGRPGHAGAPSAPAPNAQAPNAQSPNVQSPNAAAPAPSGAAAADHTGRTRPSWLGARTPAGPTAPTGAVSPPAPTSPSGAGPVLPSPGGWVPHTPTAPGPDAGTQPADERAGETAGSRADAWRRAWGLPAAPGTDDEGAQPQEGQR
ncbi:hypothetical protein ACT17Q_11960 [Cellulomonas sp. CW35]|uniref:hypothetical protein n=1 Tax=Cellulomonas sp. CW35 TaxID=3458249 RepID=UPI0040338C78